ncbi:MAG: response regulator transcription factor [Gammaproteobacteria bacterium]|jgi:DNA-binding response OmpR family regulator
MKVFVVEDDPDIRELLTLFFAAKGHEVVTANDGQEALRKLQHVQPDLMLLDVVMPKLDGWGVLTAVRAQSRIPVILLTSLDDTDDVIKGLSLGADDYLCKPFEIRELEARIQTIIRRLEPVAEPQRIARGAIEIDERAKSVTIHGEAISLSPKEFFLLALLARDLGRVYTSEEIIAELWGSDSRATGADVKQSIYQLRSKIERDPHSPQWIQNVKGFGYKLVV